MTSSVLSPLPLKYIEGTAISSPLRELGQNEDRNTGRENQRMRQLEKMLNEAQDRSEELERKAYDKAYNAGERAGMDLGRKRAEQMLETMQSLLKQCEIHARQFQEQADQVILDIAESIVRHVIGSALEEQPEYLHKMIEQAVSLLPAHETLHLAVSAQDIDMFERLLEETPAILTSDDSIESGTCRIMANDHDTLVDPQAAISECMQHIYSKLLQRKEQVAEPTEHETQPETDTPEP